MALPSSPHYEFQRPMVTGWIGKIEAAIAARKHWREVSSECELFYSKSAAAMWDPKYQRKFWSNVKPPKFRITINKAFELVAVFGPNLLWEVPHRTVNSKRPLDIPTELFQHDQGAMSIYQQLMSQQQFEEARDRVVATLMERWLNYTPQEQPGGGLIQHSELATIDALVKGRGCLWVRPYQFPSSGRTLTGAFREPPENLLIDPDFNSLDDAKWIVLRHVDPHWSVERRFKLEQNSLKGKASLESAWSHGEHSGYDQAGAHRVAGRTNDLVVWYEIWSKTGPGTRLTGMDTLVKEHLEDVVGDYAYIAVSPDVPYPLNCSTESLRRGMRDEEVKRAYSWPVPFWADDRWPVEVVDFYPETNSAWPIPPLAPGLGELKLLNFIVPWLCQRIWNSARDFWAVAGPYVEHYRKHLQEGDDQSIIPTPTAVEDVRKAVQILQQPETRSDVWRIIEFLSEMFERRTGLTDFAYGKNEGGTQNRTAEETLAKARAVGVRPEHMQKKVVAWQSRIASLEGFVSRWFVKGQDVEPLLGPVGRYLWEQYVMSGDVEHVVRQMQYDVAAASIRRPNRDRDIANYQQVLTIFGPITQAYGQQSGNYEPFNALMRKWAKFHDADLDDAEIPPQQQDEQAMQLQQQQMQLEMQKMQAELQGKQMDLQAKMVDAQLKQATEGMKIEGQQKQLDMDQERFEQDMLQDQAVHLMDMLQDRQVHRQDMAQDKQAGELKLELARKQAAAKPKPSTNGSRNGSGK